MRKIALCTALIITLVLTAFPALAEGTSALVSFDPQTKVITVSGYSAGNTIIKTLPSNVSESAVSPSSLPTDIDQIYSEGNFTYTFSMPDAASYGKYKVYVINSLGRDDDAFMYYDPAQAELIIPTLNAQTTAADLSAKIDLNAGALGIDKENALYSANLSSAGDILFELFMPFADSGDFYNKFYGTLAMAGMKNAARDKTEELMMKYQANLSISYDADYLPLTENMKKDLCVLLSALNFKDELKALKTDGEAVTFKNVLLRLKAVCAVKNAQSWSEIKNIFNIDYNSVLDIIMTSNTDYNTNIENAVFIKLAENTAFAGFGDLKSKFNAAVSAALTPSGEGDGDGDGGGSGGGSGGGGGRVSVSNDFKAPENQYDETQSGVSVDGVVKTSFKRPLLAEKKEDYTDIAKTGWEYEAVSTLGGNKIIAGYEDGTFRSGNEITRAEFTKLIVSAFDIKAEKTEFSDVAKDAWYYPYVSVAAGSGVINGYNGLFNPDACITREDAAVIIYRVSESLGENYYGEASFVDLEETSLYAMTAVRGLGSAKIINGDENMHFNPKASLTRAQAAQIIYNFIEKLG